MIGHKLLAIGVITGSVIVGCSSGGSGTCADVGLDGPVRATRDEAFSAFLSGHPQVVGDATDASDWKERSSESTLTWLDAKTKPTAITNAARDPQLGSLRLTSTASGWKVDGGCVN